MHGCINFGLGAYLQEFIASDVVGPREVLTNKYTRHQVDFFDPSGFSW